LLPTLAVRDRAGVSGLPINIPHDFYYLERDLALLAGVLLGKTRLNSLYGLMCGRRRTVPQFCLS
jgi:hypothetical protein